MFATVALAGVSGLEAVNFTLYGTALVALLRGDADERRRGSTGEL